MGRFACQHDVVSVSLVRGVAFVPMYLIYPTYISRSIGYKQVIHINTLSTQAAYIESTYLLVSYVLME
jgi:hypothetical protein